MQMKTILLSCLIVASVIFTGCAGRLTPKGASALTTLAVYELGKDSPKRADLMRKIQPVACAVAKEPGSVVEDVIGAIQNAGGVSADTKETLQVLLTIYQTAIAPSDTNQAKSHPYLEAVICDGWAGGLALLPESAGGAAMIRRNAPAIKLPRGKWVVIE